MSNAGFLKGRYLQQTESQNIPLRKFFANDSSLFDFLDSCEKSPHFWHCKSTVFSQMSQAFWNFSSFSKIIQHPILPEFRQIPQNEAIAKIPFFANVFANCLFQNVKERMCINLYDSDFHRLFFLNVRNIGDAGITFCAEWIDVHPILSPDNNLGQFLVHILILYISQHALKDAVVHPCADGFHQFHDLTAPFVIADVVSHYIKMLPFHTLYFIYITILPRRA